MAEFSKLVITAKGQALIAKMIAGVGNIEFTKVSASSTTYTLSQLEALTALSNVKQTSLISKKTITNNVAIKLEAAFTNTDLTAGYNMKALGLYAKDPDAGEILYAVTIETSGNCYMPPYNGITVSGAYIQLVTTVGNADSVNLKVDPAAVATIGDIQELEAKIADLQAFVGYTDAHIYGVEVDFKNKKFTRLAGAFGKTGGHAFDSVHCFGGRRRCNVTNDGKVVAYYGEGAFSTTGKLAQSVTIESGQYAGTYAAGTPVQVMVEQPRFYYKVVPLETEIVTEGENHGHYTRKIRYYICDEPETGFKLHPAFVENGNENDYIYLAAFEGSLWDSSASAYILDDAQVADFSADMLSSIAAVKPMSGLTQNLTRANTRKLANNRGKGWEQAYAATVAASQLLMLVEYASFNMQSAIGNGAVSKTDDSSSNMAEYTGATAELGNDSGAVTNANGIQIVSYRGEENFWGNIWGWVDGMNIQNPTPFDVLVSSADCTLQIMALQTIPGTRLIRIPGFVPATVRAIFPPLATLKTSIGCLFPPNTTVAPPFLSVTTIGTITLVGGSLHWAVDGRMVWDRGLSIGISTVPLLVALGLSAGGRCISRPKRPRKQAI